MNDIQLAELFVKRASLAEEMAKIDDEITKAVLAKGESVKIAGVTATYYKPGFETPDYESAVRVLNPDIESLTVFKDYSTTKVTTKWKELCEFLGIKAASGSPKPARVVIK